MFIRAAFYSARPIQIREAQLISAFRPKMKQGSSPVPHRHTPRRPNLVDRRLVAREGGAREVALEVRVLIWGIGGGGAHDGEAGWWWGRDGGKPE
jgi:hypothetical protein